MIKITYKLILLLSLLAMTVTSFAASEAEYGKVSKAWTLHADGSQEYRSSMELTLFTHTAMNSTYGESFIDSTRHFDNNFWRYYSREFSNSTRREVQECIGGINNEVLYAKFDEIKTLVVDHKTRDIIHNTKKYIEILENIPFSQASCDEIFKILTNINNYELSKKDLEKK